VKKNCSLTFAQTWDSQNTVPQLYQLNDPAAYYILRKTKIKYIIIKYSYCSCILFKNIYFFQVKLNNKEINQIGLATMVRHYFTLPCLNLLFIFSNGF
jgi:hypothetical protein